MNKPTIVSPTASSPGHESDVTRVNRRHFLTSGAATAVFGTLAVKSAFSSALAINTPPPTSVLFFETGTTQWLFSSNPVTWDQALRLPHSETVTDPYGPGWLLAPMKNGTDFVNAAAVTKRAMGDLRDRRGPFIGVFQVEKLEPNGGWANLDGSYANVRWAKGEPNDGKPKHRNILREKAFRDALTQGANGVIDWYFGAGSSKKVDKITSLVINEISRPVDNIKHDDVAALFHEKDGTIACADVYYLSNYPVLMSRRKPTNQTPGPRPTWPKVNGRTDLTDGMKVPRRSYLQWRWTGGARLGQIHVVNVRTGQTVINRDQAATPQQDLTALRPGEYLFRVRNISRNRDPWLEIGFVVV